MAERAIESIIRVRVTAPTLEDMRSFIDETRPDLGCRPVAQRTTNGFVTDVYVLKSRIADTRAARSGTNVDLKIIEDITEIGLARQAEVGQGNRFAVRGIVPRGLGRKE
jgi:hypothetical protein